MLIDYINFGKCAMTSSRTRALGLIVAIAFLAAGCATQQPKEQPKAPVEAPQVAPAVPKAEAKPVTKPVQSAPMAVNPLEDRRTGRL